MGAKGKKLTLSGTRIERNMSSNDGGGFYLYNGTIEMHDGTLSQNTSIGDSGGAEVTSKTNFEANNVTVSGNLSETGVGGGIGNFGTTVLENCTVASNSSKMQGGGIYNDSDGGSAGDLTLMGCVVSGNSSESNGGGIYSDKKLKVSGGAISKSTSSSGEEIPGNTAVGNGGGIYIDKGSETAAIERNLVVLGNTADAYGNDVCLYSKKTLALAGALEQNAAIGVDLEDGAGVVTTDYKKHNGTTNPNEYFAVARGCNLGLNAKGEVEITSEWAKLKYRIENAKNGDTIPLDKDYAACRSDERIEIPAGKSVTVDLCGFTLNRDRECADVNGQVFEVLGTLTIKDSSPGKSGTITGGWSTTFGGGIHIMTGGVLNLEGGTIAGNRAVVGAGICVVGVLNMKGGAVKDNEALKTTDMFFPDIGGYGGGICLPENSVLNLEGGTVSGNKAAETGGGILVGEGAKAFIKGNPIVRKNTASGAGGDIYLRTSGRLDVAGAFVDGAHMGVAMEDEMGAFTSGYSSFNSGKDPAQYFVSTEGYAVILENNEAAMGQSTFGETDYEKPFISRNDQVNVNSDDLVSQNWMSGISGERYLNEINMPGSHDAGMHKIQKLDSGYFDYTALVTCIDYSKGAEYAQTQYRFIDEQIASGARQVDIRLNDCYRAKKWYGYDWEDDGKSLWICHGTKSTVGTYYALDHDDNVLSFNKVLDWVKDFLKKHPTETIILNIRPETMHSDHEGTIRQRALAILRTSALETNPSTGETYLYKENDSDNYFAPYTHMPQLKDCRGKIVLLPKGEEFVK